MSDESQSVMTAKSSMTVDIDRILQVLTMEYQSLNAQIIARLSARYQFLGFLTAGSAILAAASGHPIFNSGTWVLATLAVGVFALGLFCFWYLGRNMAILSARVAGIEERINELISSESSNVSKLLSWESDRQRRTSIGLFLEGLRSPWKPSVEMTSNDE
jgi:hypothetical protein